MKTAESIEQQQEKKSGPSSYKGKGIGSNPNSHTKVGKRYTSNHRGVLPEQLQPHAWKPGQSGNPGGRPRHDVSSRIARAVFEENEELMYRAFARAALKGNAYAFQVLADRAYGKLKQSVDVTVGEFKDVPTDDLAAEISRLERRLGLAKQVDDASEIGISAARNAVADKTPQD